MRNDSPSDTALLIAKSLLLLSRDPERRSLVHAEDAQILERMIMEAGSRPLFEWLARYHPGRSLLFAIERMLLDGIQLHYACRKRWIEGKVREALDGGVRQVIMVAAGFDLLAWRLSREFAEVIFFELDHPATQRPKKKVLGEPERLHFLPVDLAVTGPREAMAGHPAYSPDQSAVCLAEGLLMYLDTPEVSGLLADLSFLASPAGAVIFTFMEKNPSGGIDFRDQSPLVARWLGKRREPFRWGIARENLPAFLTPCGLDAAGIADHGIFREQFLKPAGLGLFPLACGECACLGLPSSS